MRNCQVVLVILAIGAVQGLALQRPLGAELTQNCPFDYSPCQCTNEGIDGLQIACLNVSTAEVQSVFSRSEEATYSLLWLEGTFTSLPSDLLSGKRVRQIVLKFSGHPPESIDAGVFASSRDFTTALTLVTSESSALDLAFLSDFTALETVLYLGSWSAFRSIPPLPKLKSLVSNSPGFQDLLDSISAYKDSLQYLAISGVNMTRFPAEIQPLDHLVELDLSYNRFDVLTTGSVALSAKLSNLKLINSFIHSIEPGAFQGDFSRTHISLYFHQMDHLKEGAFRELLQSMANANDPEANLLLSSNHHLICDCQLSWLLVSNRHLLDRVDSGRCTDQTSSRVYKLKDYDIRKLANCPGVYTEPSTSPSPSGSAELTASFALPLAALFGVFKLAV